MDIAASKCKYVFEWVHVVHVFNTTLHLRSPEHEVFDKPLHKWDKKKPCTGLSTSYKLCFSLVKITSEILHLVCLKRSLQKSATGTGNEMTVTKTCSCCFATNRH